MQLKVLLIHGTGQFLVWLLLEQMMVSSSDCILYSLPLQSSFNGMNEDTFSSYKKALETRRLEKPKNMSEECRKYWTEIVSGMYHFNRGERERERTIYMYL